MLLGISQPASGAPGFTTARDTKRLRAEMRRGLRRGEFALLYRPRLDLGTGAIRGAEAKLRWPGRIGGVLPPGSFVPVAEGSELINQLGAFALAQACTDARLWGGLRVSVNISGRQLVSGALHAQIAAALGCSGLAPDCLDLELSETLLTDVDTDILLALSALRDLGVGLALDEFGTGWASLALLKRLPLTSLKLARSMVRELPQNREDSAILAALIQAAHALGLTVVADAIETQEQLACLAALGCHEGQGQLFSHPLSATQVGALASYHDETCSAVRSTPQTRHERALPH